MGLTCRNPPPLVRRCFESGMPRHKIAFFNVRISHSRVSFIAIAARRQMYIHVIGFSPIVESFHLDRGICAQKCTWLFRHSEPALAI
jgi:hypothetical protein